MPPETHPAVAATTHDVLARTAITSLKRFACPCAASRRIQAVARRRGRLTGWRLATNERDAQIRAVWCRSALRRVRVKDRRHDVSHRTSIRHIMHTIHVVRLLPCTAVASTEPVTPGIEASPHHSLGLAFLSMSGRAALREAPRRLGRVRTCGGK